MPFSHTIPANEEILGKNRHNSPFLRQLIHEPVQRLGNQGSILLLE
jgi:hypothetical protein